MKAYNEAWIYNREITNQAQRWHREGLVNDAQLAAIKETFPVRFRDTSAFVEIGLFLFSIVAASGGYALLGLILSDVLQESFATGLFNILLGIGIGFLVEFLIRKQGMFRNGVDNALIAFMTALLVIGLNVWLPDNTSVWARCLVSLPVLFAVVWYYGDLIVMVGLVSAVYALVFDLLNDTAAAHVIIPFVMMALSAGLYWLALQLDLSLRSQKNVYWSDTLNLAQWMTLSLLLINGNYFFVREVVSFLLKPDLNLRGAFSGAPQIALSWLFWLFTFGIPLLYGYLGTTHRNRMFIILACLGTAGAVATAREYIGVLPWSVHLTVSGLLLVLVSIPLIRYLREPRYGFTDVPDEDSPKEFFLDAETIGAIQAASSTQQPKGFSYGGGDFGGGGAGKEY
ncbi:hypothetical protein GCM10023187_09510 [Nibrella viscosa]|uniref:DUF2157 domain-containing protein n=1 Tax=Nibrella viscosa TaxID=1084524 RepID=A0ABP8K0A9_9BACT